MTDFMKLALIEAEKAAMRGEVPVGAALVSSEGKVLALASNRTEELKDATAHAEMLVIREGSQKIKTPRLTECDLYVTLEPCAMCAAAISFARLRRVYFGAYDPKGGAIDHGPRFYGQTTCHHAPEVVGGVEELEAKNLLQKFFGEKR